MFDKPPATDITGLSPYPWAAGALVANAADVASFYRALLSGRMLTPVPSVRSKRPLPEKRERDGRPLRARHRTARDALRNRLGPQRQLPGYNVYALSSTNGDRQVVLSINLDTTSMPKRLQPMFGRLLIGAFCSR